MKNIVYLTQSTELASWVEQVLLSPPAEIALDLEGESNRHRYGFRLCLIQIHYADNIYLIDTVEIKDLSSLQPVMEHPGIQKIMYATDFDIRLFSHIMGYRIRNVYDVQLAAKLLEYEKINLPFLLMQCLNVEFIKNSKMQKCDWNLRPLSKEQIEYAADDVSYLIDLKHKLVREIETAGLTTKLDLMNKASEERSFKRKYRAWLSVKHSRSLSATEKVYLKYFFKARDKVARKLDFPVYWVMPDESLLLVCRQVPANEEQWKQSRALAPKAMVHLPLFEKAIEEAKAEISQPQLRPVEDTPSDYSY